jgi:hypothetical protein
MKEKLKFIRLPVLLVVLFFLGKLAMGAAGASYEAGNRVFSMVILQTHLALLWAAVGRRYKGYGVKDAVIVVIMITFVSQILIMAATAGSYLLGTDTHFNYPEALGSETAVEFIPAMLSRVGGLVVNCIVSAILASIGWALGGLIPAGTAVSRDKVVV